MKASGVQRAAAREFHYRIGWRTRHALPGHHRSGRAGAGHEYAATAPLLDHPDPRRLDIRRSVRDPFGQLFVRTYNQPGILPVYAVVDLTASMSFQGVASKLSLLAEFLSILEFSTGRTGDPLGIVGCANKVLSQFSLPATRNGEAVRETLRRLRAHTPAAGDARGLIDAAQIVGHRRALVFLISDFHFPLDFTRDVLRAFARHDVVPIVLWDSAEFRNTPAFGLARIHDSETRAARYILLRPSVRQRLSEAFQRRRKSLEAVFVEFGYKPYFLLDSIDCDDLNQYFVER
jgi:uncharacterized protein (DUF58 family)